MTMVEGSQTITETEKSNEMSVIDKYFRVRKYN